MKLTSPDFKHNTLIPREFTCQGEDVNPTLVIEDVPPEAKSLVLIVDDPDAPGGTWDHWLVYNINPALTRINKDSVPGTQVVNSFRRDSWGGPCPPSGTHRYFFKLFAIDALLNLPKTARKRDMEKAMQGHILVKSELIGLYKKL